MTIHIFESVSFNCTARGFGLLEIIWKRIRHAIPVTAEITQVKSLNEITSVIKISTTVGYYSGQYYCIAKNEVGETISRIANLNVIGIESNTMMLLSNHILYMCIHTLYVHAYMHHFNMRTYVSTYKSTYKHNDIQVDSHASPRPLYKWIM